MPVTFYKKNEFKEAEEKYRMVYNVLEHICSAHRERNGTGYTSSVNKDYYAYIPNGIYEVVEQISFVCNYMKSKRKGLYGKKFLDVGSGIGMIMELAKRHFYAYGIEINKDLIKRQRQIFRHSKKIMDKTIFSVDALRFRRYDEFDIIYYYVPIKNKELESKLERKIENQMKKGAILIADSKVDDKIQKDKRFTRLTNRFPIYEKVSK